jgi:hypothetical protein
MSIDDKHVNGPIVVSSTIPLILVIKTPANMSEILNIRLWTGTSLRTGEPAAVVEKVSVYRTDSSITCYDLNVYYNQTENSTVQNLAMIYFKYVNSGTHIYNNLIKLRFEIRFVPEKVNFAETYVVFVAAGNVTSEYEIKMSLPEILNDRNNTFIGQFHKLLDGDNNTCVNLPSDGDFPPIFWTRFHISWLGVSATPFQITLIGTNISCQRSGYLIPQVSPLRYPYHRATSLEY